MRHAAFWAACLLSAGMRLAAALAPGALARGGLAPGALPCALARGRLALGALPSRRLLLRGGLLASGALASRRLLLRGGLLASGALAAAARLGGAPAHRPAATHRRRWRGRCSRWLRCGPDRSRLLLR